MSNTVLLVDDHLMFRDGLKAILEAEPGFTVVGEAANGKMALELCRELAPDVVVMDISMPEMNGIEATKLIAAEKLKSRVVILSMHSERIFLVEALRAGARGILIKSCASAELVSALNTVLADQTYLSPAISHLILDEVIGSPTSERQQTLTPRERQILKLLALGENVKSIGYTLGISYKTVETHRMQLMKKLDLKSMVDLVKYAARQGVIEL
ncbi:response regulator transcription factor [Geomonas sp. Red32]|uniref:response regulator n=1 Tax=Geomonas sp. Red32 TaxID=2912856 RepID=UPI00202CAE64|nr:response regulator transcription factor [Geomonas sp. Red32]MCM0083095.1 response regulator transcription factor [Geomonas sp. Red32]